MRFFGWLNKTPAVPVVRFLFTGMDLATWRAAPDLLSYARELWSQPNWQHALSALRNAAPSGYPIRGKMITDIEAAIELGRKEGYDDCMRALFSLTQRSSEPLVEVKADFDPKDYSKVEEV